MPDQVGHDGFFAIFVSERLGRQNRPVMKQGVW